MECFCRLRVTEIKYFWPQRKAFTPTLRISAKHKMAVITITSDYGLKDHYVAALKGALHSEFKNPAIVDITHQVQAFNITEAAYILRNAYEHFPEGSVHLICVNAEAVQSRPHLVMKLNGHYFIASDCGVLSMIKPEYKPELLVEVDLRNATDLNSTRTIFARLAGHLVRGGKPELLGRKVTDYKIVAQQNAVVKENGNLLIGNIIYVDRFGNLVTNIHQKQITEIGRGRSLKISISKGRRPITKIAEHYYEAKEEGKAIAIYNAGGWLEIAIFKSASDTHGGATDLLGLRLNDHISIEFG